MNKILGSRNTLYSLTHDARLASPTIMILCCFWNMIFHHWQRRITHDKWKFGPRTEITPLCFLTDSYLSEVIHWHLSVTWNQIKNLMRHLEHQSNYYNCIRVFKGDLQSVPPLCWETSTSRRRKKIALLCIECIPKLVARRLFTSMVQYLMYIKKYRDIHYPMHLIIISIYKDYNKVI